MSSDKELGAERRIIAAAKEEFSLKGRDATRVNEIAVRAGVNKAMIYYYFKSKDNLYEEVLKTIFADLLPLVIKAAMQARGIEDLLSRLVEAYISYIASNRSNVRLMLREMAAGGPLLVKVFSEHLQSRGAAIPALLKQGAQSFMEKGEMRPMDVRQLLISFAGMCGFYFASQPLLRVLLDVPEDDREFLEERKASIVDLFLNGVRPRSDDPTDKKKGRK